MGTAPSDVPVADADQPEYVDNFDDDAYDQEPYAYAYDDWQEPRERRAGLGAVAILGFLALGVLALVGGAVLAGIFSAGSGIGAGPSVPSPTAVATLDPTPSASLDAGETPAASGSPAASGERSSSPTASPPRRSPVFEAA